MKSIMHRLWFGFLLIGLIGSLSVSGIAQNDRSTSRRSKEASQERKERKTESSRQQDRAPKQVAPEKRSQERRSVQRTPERNRNEQRNVDRNQARRNDPDRSRQDPPRVDRDQMRRNDSDRSRQDPPRVDRDQMRRNDPDRNRSNPPRIDRDQVRRNDPSDRYRPPRGDRGRDNDRRFRDRGRDYRDHKSDYRGWGHDHRYKPDRDWHHPYWKKHHRPRKKYYLDFGWSPFFCLNISPVVRFTTYTRPLIHDRTYIVFTKEYDSYDYLPGDVIGYSVHITFTGYARVYDHYYERSPLLVRQFQVDAREMRRLREILETGRYYDSGTCLYDTYGDDGHPAYATIAYRHRPHDAMRSVSLNLVAPDYLYPAYFVDFMAEIDWLLEGCGYF